MKKIICLFILISFPVTAKNLDLSIEGQLDYQHSYRLIDSQSQRQNLYLTAKTKAAFQSWTLQAELRGSDDLKTIDPKILSLSFETGPLKVDAGYQQIAWGETFGFQVADLVNPRDFSDPLITETGWIRKSVALAQAQLIFDPWTFQFVFTPFPRPNTYSQKALDLSQKPDLPEFGFKVNRLFKFGLDASVLYLRHWNRNPVFLLNRPVQKQVDSLGATGSFATGSFVFRADAVLHVDQPEQGETLLEHTFANRMQAIVGVDYALSDGGLLALQYHVDDFSSGILNWVGLKIQENIWHRKFEPELFVFFGLNNCKDYWIQPKFTWNVGSAFSLALVGDFIYSEQDLRFTALPYLSEEDRVMLWGTFKF